AGIHLAYRVLIDEICRDGVIWKSLSWGEAIGSVECQPGRVVRGRDNWNLRGCRREDIRERLAECGEVGCRNRSCDSRRAALNLSAPFFIDEEKCVVADVSAKVAAGYVQAEFRTRFACLVQEVVIRLIGFVSVEFPNRAMEVLRSGLDHHRDGAAGADSVVGAVITVERLELRERINRGQGTETAATSAIVQLAAIEQIDVVTGARSVEADAVRTGEGIRAGIGREVV